MNDKLIDIISMLLKSYNLYNYDNDKRLKNTKITSYYDIENIKHLKIDLGYETYILTIDEEE